MTFREAMIEANRRMGVPHEDTIEHMRDATSLLPNNRIDEPLDPGTEEKVIAGLIAFAGHVRALTAEQRIAIHEHILATHTGAN